jgi:GntR family transcriptional repressor for pyruvate dehydrogenase complex
MAASAPNQDLVAAVLSLLAEADRPTGASVIHERLLDQGFQLSEPTVGRLLRELDRRGLTARQGRLGRLVTAQGQEELQRLRDSSSREQNTRQFLDSLRAGTLADVVNVLAARRGIEREMARAAALHATPEDISALRDYDGMVRAGKIVDGLHGHLAAAAHNPVLDSVFRLITQDPEVRRVVNHIMRDRGKLLDLGFNQRLITAIQNRDPDAAETAVRDHLDEVLAAVEDFWSALRRAAGEPVSGDEELAGERPAPAH